MSIQDRIMERLNDLGLSMRGASIEAGLGPTAVRDIIKNRDQSPRVETLVALSYVLNSPYSWLIDGVGEKEIDYDKLVMDELIEALKMVSLDNKRRLVPLINALAIMEHLFGENWDSYTATDPIWGSARRKLRSDRGPKMSE